MHNGINGYSPYHPVYSAQGTSNSATFDAQPGGSHDRGFRDFAVANTYDYNHHLENWGTNLQEGPVARRLPSISTLLRNTHIKLDAIHAEQNPSWGEASTSLQFQSFNEQSPYVTYATQNLLATLEDPHYPVSSGTTHWVDTSNTNLPMSTADAFFVNSDEQQATIPYLPQMQKSNEKEGERYDADFVNASRSALGKSTATLEAIVEKISRMCPKKHDQIKQKRSVLNTLRSTIKNRKKKGNKVKEPILYNADIIDASKSSLKKSTATLEATLATICRMGTENEIQEENKKAALNRLRGTIKNRKKKEKALHGT